MDVQIINKSRFKVIGIEGRGESDKGPTWIQPLWSTAFTRFSEIQSLVKPNQGAWGLMSAIDEHLAPWKDDGKYLAGWELITGQKPPQGWTVWEVPAQTFAVVATTFKTYGDIFRYITQQYLPKEGYKQVGAIHEFYPVDFKDSEKDSICLYFTVKKTNY